MLIVVGRVWVLQVFSKLVGGNVWLQILGTLLRKGAEYLLFGTIQGQQEMNVPLDILLYDGGSPFNHGPGANGLALCQVNLC